MRMYCGAFIDISTIPVSQPSGAFIDISTIAVSQPSGADVHPVPEWRPVQRWPSPTSPSIEDVDHCRRHRRFPSFWTAAFPGRTWAACALDMSHGIRALCALDCKHGQSINNPLSRCTTNLFGRKCTPLITCVRVSSHTPNTIQSIKTC